MAKRCYIIRDTIACWVTFTHTVEADTKDDAMKAYMNGVDICDTPPIIGDAIDYLPQEISFKEEIS